MAFSNKAKIINISIPEKIKNFIEEHFVKEIHHFKKKYKFEFNFISDKNLIIPEYKIDLLNKNKKIIKKIQNSERIETDFIKRDRTRKEFVNKNYNKKFIKRSGSKNKYNDRLKFEKNNINNKKLARY